MFNKKVVYISEKINLYIYFRELYTTQFTPKYLSVQLGWCTITPTKNNVESKDVANEDLRYA